MADSFEEIVHFEWQVDSTEVAAKRMLDSLGKIDAKLNSLYGTSKETWGNVATSMTPAHERIDALITKYQLLIELQRQLAGSPPITPQSTAAGNAPGGYNVVSTGVQAYRGGPFVTQATLPDDVKEYVKQYKENLQAELGRPVQGTGGGSSKPEFRFTTEDWSRQGYSQPTPPLPSSGLSSSDLNNISSSIQSLPQLLEGYVRVVHMTSQSAAESIARTGLNYEKQGAISGTARAWGDPSQAQFSLDDPRFAGNSAVVMDMRQEEWRLHNSYEKSPGIVDPSRIVGIISPVDAAAKSLSDLDQAAKGFTTGGAEAASQMTFLSRSTASFGETAREIQSYRDLLSQRLNLPTGEIQAAFGNLEEASQKIIELGAAAQTLAAVSVPLLASAAVAASGISGAGDFGFSGRDAAGRFIQGNTFWQSQARDELGRFGQADLSAQGYRFPSTALTTRPDMSWTSQQQAWPWAPAPTPLQIAGPQPQIIPPPPPYSPNFTGNFGSNANAIINNAGYSFSQPYPPTSGGTGYTTAGAQQPLPPAGVIGGGAGGIPPGGPPAPPGIPPYPFPGPTPQQVAALQQGATGVSNLNTQFQQGAGHASQFERAIGRIALYMVIFEGFRITADIIRGVVDEMLRLEDVSIRVGFITGASQGQTQYQFTQAAAAGISPQQAAPGILSAAQLGLSPESQEDARRLSVVFGAEKYSEIVDEINELQSRANILGIENVNILDFMAESYKTLNGTITDYSDALDVGMQTGAAFGLSAEQMGLAIERVSRTSGESTKFVGNLVQSTLDNLQKKDVQEQLQDRFGIKPGDPESMTLQIADLQKQLAQSGNQAAIQDMMGIIQGGLAGPSRTRQLPLFFEETAKSIRAATEALAEFDDLYNGVMSGGPQKINQMTAAWRLFLASVGDTKVFKDVADSITLILNTMTSTNQFKTGWESLKPERQTQLLQQFTEETGIGTQSGDPNKPFYGTNLNPNTPSPVYTNNNPFDQAAILFAFEQWMIRAINGIPTGGGSPDHNIGDRYGYRGNQLPEPYVGSKMRPLNAPPPPDFGGFNTYTEEQSDAMPFDKFEDLVRSYEKQISGLGGYELDQRTEVYYDESTRTWRTMLADSNAIRFATEEMRKMQQEQITGTFNVPDGGRSVAVLFNALTAGFRPESFLNKGGAGDLSVQLRPSLDGMAGAAGQMSSAAIAFLNAITATMGRPGESPYGGRNTIRNVYTGDNVVGRGEVERGTGYTSDSPTGADRWRRDLPGYNPTQEEVRTPRRIDPNRMTQQERPEMLYPRDNPFQVDEDYMSSRNRPVASSNRGGRQAGGRPMTPRETAAAPSAPININNRIMVTIDGRLLASYMNRRIYREFENIRNSNSNGPNTSGMVG